MKKELQTSVDDKEHNGKRKRFRTRNCSCPGDWFLRQCSATCTRPLFIFIFGHFPSPRSHGVEKTANELVAGQKLRKESPSRVSSVLTSFISHVSAEVFLQIRVFVVVDPHESVPRSLRQVLYERCFTTRRGTLQKNGVSPKKHRPSQIREMPANSGCDDILALLGIDARQFASLDPEMLEQNVRVTGWRIWRIFDSLQW